MIATIGIVAGGILGFALLSAWLKDGPIEHWIKQCPWGRAAGVSPESVVWNTHAQAAHQSLMAILYGPVVETGMQFEEYYFESVDGVVVREYTSQISFDWHFPAHVVGQSAADIELELRCHGTTYDMQDRSIELVRDAWQAISLEVGVGAGKLIFDIDALKWVKQQEHLGLKLRHYPLGDDASKVAWPDEVYALPLGEYSHEGQAFNKREFLQHEAAWNQRDTLGW